MSDTVDKPIVLLGAGGHCRSVIDVVRAAERAIVGILDRPDTSIRETCGIRVIGTDEDIPEHVRAGAEFLIGLGDLGLPRKRMRLSALLDRFGARMARVVSPHAHVSTMAELAAGTIAMHRSVVNAAAVVGRNAVINTGAIIEHDVQLGDYVQIAPGAIVNGGTTIGARSYVGSGAVIREGLSIAPDTVVGMGAVVVGDIHEPDGVYLGVPAKRIQNEHP